MVSTLSSNRRGANNARPRFVRLDRVIHLSALGGHKRIGESLAEFPGLPPPHGIAIRSHGQLRRQTMLTAPSGPMTAISGVYASSVGFRVRQSHRRASGSHDGRGRGGLLPSRRRRTSQFSEWRYPGGAAVRALQKPADPARRLQAPASSRSLRRQDKRRGNEAGRQSPGPPYSAARATHSRRQPAPRKNSGRPGSPRYNFRSSTSTTSFSRIANSFE